MEAVFPSVWHAGHVLTGSMDGDTLILTRIERCSKKIRGLSRGLSRTRGCRGVEGMDFSWNLLLWAGVIYSPIIAAWVFMDAPKHKLSRATWAVSALLVPLIVPYYLRRTRAGKALKYNATCRGINAAMIEP